MTRTTIGTTLFALAALAAAGCAADTPAGPTALPSRPSLLRSVESVDRNGNGVWCARRVGQDKDLEPAIAPMSLNVVLIDDVDGSCPPGFQRSHEL